MSRAAYLEQASQILQKIETETQAAIDQAAGWMAEAIASRHVVHAFGSGHSVIPVMDIFPRYGGIVGFHPLMDPRLMWSNVVGPGGAPELLWIERAEGYIANFLNGFRLDPEDIMLIYSHGGVNAAPVETALYAKERGLKVVAVTSVENWRQAKPTHSSGKHLADLADCVIDNCVPLQDAIVSVPGLDYPVGAISTVATVVITQALAAEVASRLVQEHKMTPSVFVSPTVTSVKREHNHEVYADYIGRVKYSHG